MDHYATSPHVNEMGESSAQSDKLMMMDGINDQQLESGYQTTTSVSSWPPSTPVPPTYPTYDYPQNNAPESSFTVNNVATTNPINTSTSTNINTTTSMINASSNQGISPFQLQDVVDGRVLMEEMENIMSTSTDDVVLTNSVCLLFRWSIDIMHGYDVCQAMASSSAIMNQLYRIIDTEHHGPENTMLCYATGNLTLISKFEETREVLLSQDSALSQNKPSPGVQSLIRSLRIEDTNVIIFAITAIHNLLLDRRPEIQEMAKQQIKYGIREILMLLDNKCLEHNDEFKVIVLDCLQILAFRNMENRLLMKDCEGPRLILQTIQKKFPSETLIETASRVLKSLSACSKNKIDIIKYDGIKILTLCIETSSNLEIMKTCLWTLRNLSDVMTSINQKDPKQFQYIIELVDIILKTLENHAEKPNIVTCALGILANLTCNNECIKQQICSRNGVELLIGILREFYIADKEILEPAICVLCHLMNQTERPELADHARFRVIESRTLFQPLYDQSSAMSSDLSKAATKLHNLTFMR